MRTGWGMNPASWWGCRPAGTPPHLALCCWCALLHQSPRRKACVGLLGFGTHLTWTAPALPAENGYPQRCGPVAARDAVGRRKQVPWRPTARYSRSVLPFSPRKGTPGGGPRSVSLPPWDVSHRTKSGCPQGGVQYGSDPGRPGQRRPTTFGSSAGAPRRLFSSIDWLAAI